MPKKISFYKVRAKVLARWFEAEDQDLSQALRKIEVTNGKGVAVISVSKDGKSKDRILGRIETLRLFNKNPQIKEMAIKNLIPAFNGLL